jgi:hypothetical protein
LRSRAKYEATAAAKAQTDQALAEAAEARRDLAAAQREVAFLNEGLAEVQNVNRLVYHENQELRLRLGHLTDLLESLASCARLPDEAQRKLGRVLQTAVPPQFSFDTVSVSGDGRALHGDLEEGCTFAKLCFSLSRTLDSRSHASQTSRRGSGDPEEAEKEALLALEYRERSAWGRTNSVVQDLCTGWTEY